MITWSAGGAPGVIRFSAEVHGGPGRSVACAADT